ncbi:MAG: hypothetical protein J7M38_02975 [Armatimonadetes bacterium]|nr:hypothetical protein [Armatimonadota bacterium]
MKEEVRNFIEQTAQDLAGLEVALFYQANPRAFDTAAGIALRTHRSVTEVEPALERLCEHGILEVFHRGDGRYHCYALSPTRETWNLLCMVSEAYHDDPEARRDIIKLLIERRMAQRASNCAGAESAENA